MIVLRLAICFCCFVAILTTCVSAAFPPYLKMASNFPRADVPYPHLFPLLGNGVPEHDIRPGDRARKNGGEERHLSSSPFWTSFCLPGEIQRSEVRPLLLSDACPDS
jgi:hypothetical protein